MYSPLTTAAEGGGVAVGGAGVRVGMGTVGVLTVPTSGEEQAESPRIKINRRLRKSPANRLKRKIPGETSEVFCKGWAVEGIVQIIN
jgi:hypothetical protein